MIVEDEPGVADYLSRAFEEFGYETAVAWDGEEALDLWPSFDPAVVTLDLSLPGMDGWKTLSAARKKNWTTPVLIYSARDTIPDKVSALDCGADDYLAKPAALEEIRARVRALQRRGDRSEGKMSFGDLEIHPRTGEVRRGAESIKMSDTGLRLLLCLAAHAPNVLTKRKLLELVWDDPEGNENLVEVHISFLRAKIERPGRPAVIHTSGDGYFLSGGKSESRR